LQLQQNKFAQEQFMGTVQLSDIVDVKVFQDLPSVVSPEKTVFFQSGIVVSNPLLNGLATAAGKIAELPFWRDLSASDEPNRSNDDPDSIATPKNVSQGSQISRKVFLNQGWSAADLAVEIAMGENAMTHIRNRVDTYWLRQWQRRLIAACNGVLADNIANDASDMVYVAAAATNAGVSANTVFTRQNFTTAAFTLGDSVGDIAAIAVHSIVYKRMVDNDDIDYIPDAAGNMTIPTYLGKRVFVDDSLPFTPAAGAGGGDAAPRFTSILFGGSSSGYGDGQPTVPVEIERQAAQGQGGGIETIWTRKTWILHPFGFQHTGTPANNETGFNLAELALATSWDRVVERKNVPLAFLVTNG
jgi:hypothetical protein